MKRLSPEKVIEFINQLQQQKSTRQVADELNVSLYSVIKIRKNNEENIPPPHPGRPKVISTRTTAALVRHYNAGDFKTYKEGQRFAQSSEGKQIHLTTVRQNLLQQGVKKYTQSRKPNLNSDQIAKRLQFAKEHIHWTVDNWKRVMFSDETMVSRLGSFGKSYYHCQTNHRQFHPRQVKATLQGGGGKMMVWGCITFFGVGDASWIKETITSDVYLDVVQDYVRQSRDFWGMDESTFIFQQDNARVHTTRKVM